MESTSLSVISRYCRRQNAYFRRHLFGYFKPLFSLFHSFGSFWVTSVRAFMFDRKLQISAVSLYLTQQKN